MAAGTFIPGSATTSGWEGMRRRPNAPEAEFGAGGFGGAMAAAGKPTIQHTPSRYERDEDFWKSLKEQAEESGQNYDKADQPFMNLSPATVGNARIQPAEMRSMVPSIANIRGTPLGSSYNPYLGDPAKRKKVR